MINKTKFLTGVAAIALSAGFAGAASAETAEAGNPYAGDFTVGADFTTGADLLTPMGGSISPLYGKINPFFGNISPFYGNISPFYGNISPFFGNINPFFGNISPFYGNISPFWGNISPFYGNINPFWGNISPFYGKINPFWGNISPFWGEVIPQWGDIYSQWGNISPFDETASAQYTDVLNQLRATYDRAEQVWGTQVKSQTGQDFWNGFAKKIFDKYHLDLNDASTLANLSAPDRAAFFMDFYDNLMQFSGQDQVDYWMPMVNWRPVLTQDQTTDEKVQIGLLDGGVAEGEMFEEVEFVGGYETFENPHGAAVASLFGAAHDGKGIMGIAPNAEILNYNPFDHTGTTNWTDVETGIMTLTQSGADIVNLSLGVPGHVLSQGWLDILLSSKNYGDTRDVIFVMAAGNEGIAQTTNIDATVWNPLANLIIVGSVGPSGEISAFSNTPGEACVTTSGYCQPGDKLKNHFIVAPGESILVSDNNGGVTRMSGTSFATPLVTGTFALLFDRWPWLEDRPEDAVQIVLKTAKDLGAPGVDPIYGHGLLDIEAAQSPFSFDNLLIFMGYQQVSSSQLKRALLSPTQRATWEAKGASLTVFEYAGSTLRDFAVPLSSRLHGAESSDERVDGQYQRHIQNRMLDWATGAGLTDINSVHATGKTSSGWTFALTATEQNQYADSYDAQLPFKQDVRFTNDKSGVTLQFGYGDGAISLVGSDAFGFYSDYGAATGGVNPVLGFASGGAYGATGVKLSKKATLTLGLTQASDDHTSIDADTGQIVSDSPGIDTYEAAAYVADLRYDVSKRLRVNAGYTLLEEATGLLGVQGAGALSLSGGAQTDAITVGADYTLAPGLTLAASATTAETRGSGFTNSALAVGDDGIRSTAFVVAANKLGVFGKDDAMRMSITQPLSIESGSLSYTSYQVVDRETGALGLVTDKWSIESANPELNAEMLYAKPLLRNWAKLSLAGTVDLNQADGADLSAPFALTSKLAFTF